MPTTDSDGTQTDTNQQVLDMLKAFMAEQRATNADLRAQQSQLMSYLEVDTTEGLAAAQMAEQDEKAAHDVDQQQMDTVRNSRTSVYLHNSNNTHSTVESNNMLSPSQFTQPKVRPPTAAEQQRRASHGIPFSTPNPKHKTIDRSATLASIPGGPIDKSRSSPYGQASYALSKMDKFYGDKQHDKGIDVYSFARSVDFTLNVWMPEQMMGRLELVISCTGGPAQMWLLGKREDLNVLVMREQLRPELAEWNSVKEEFIERLGGGQSQRLYHSKLGSLKMGRGDSSDEVTKFITSFRDYAMRAYPLDRYPDTKARSLMLGQMFDERLSASDIAVWTEAMRTRPTPETLEEWELAASTAWTTEQTVKERTRRKMWNKGAGTSQSTAQAVNEMQTEGETEDGNQEGTSEGGQRLNAVAASAPRSKGNGSAKAKNKYIDGKTAMTLIRLNRCLHCYQGGHFARECKAPAKRKPSEKELNEKADQ